MKFYEIDKLCCTGVLFKELATIANDFVQVQLGKHMQGGEVEVTSILQVRCRAVVYCLKVQDQIRP